MVQISHLIHFYVLDSKRENVGKLGLPSISLTELRELQTYQRMPQGDAYFQFFGITFAQRAFADAEGSTMSSILSPRRDAFYNPPTDAKRPVLDNELARADGLTPAEATELAGWLKQAGYDSIEVIHEKSHSCVIWHR